MKQTPFFNDNDTKYIAGLSYWQGADFLNRKLSELGVVVYGCGEKGFGWLDHKDLAYIQTHQALLINIQKIDEEKPKCPEKFHILLEAANKVVCGDGGECHVCGQKLGGE